MRTLADKSPSFGKPSAALAIGPLSEKLGDMKLKKPAGDALVAFAEKTSFAFVLAQGTFSFLVHMPSSCQSCAIQS
jgi:cytoskeleton-associated protein 5